MDGLSGEIERLTSWLCKSEVDLLWPMCSLSAIRLIMLGLRQWDNKEIVRQERQRAVKDKLLYRTRAPIGLVLMLTRFLGAEVYRSS